jgi:hypothetical protein
MHAWKGSGTGRGGRPNRFVAGVLASASQVDVVDSVVNREAVGADD